MTVTIKRLFEADGGVFSLLWTPGVKTLFAAEPIDRAIPEGVYTLRRDTTGRFRHWVILGPDVGLAGSGLGWEQVEVHEGNWPTIDSRACVLPGLGLKAMVPPDRDAPLMAVTQSKAALSMLHDALGDEDHELIVLGLPA